MPNCTTYIEINNDHSYLVIIKIIYNENCIINLSLAVIHRKKLTSEKYMCSNYALKYYFV